MGQESSQMDKEAECNANANNDLKEGIYLKKIPWPYPTVMAS